MKASLPHSTQVHGDGEHVGVSAGACVPSAFGTRQILGRRRDSRVGGPRTALPREDLAVSASDRQRELGERGVRFGLRPIPLRRCEGNVSGGAAAIEDQLLKGQPGREQVGGRWRVEARDGEVSSRELPRGQQRAKRKHGLIAPLPGLRGGQARPPGAAGNRDIRSSPIGLRPYGPQPGVVINGGRDRFSQGQAHLRVRKCGKRDNKKATHEPGASSHLLQRCSPAEKVTRLQFEAVAVTNRRSLHLSGEGGDTHRADDYADLVRQASTGDALAMERLLMRAQEVAYRFSWLVCGHPQDAEDVMQDALIRTYER